MDMVIAPSSPKQELMLNQKADIAILGGAMGSGKSWISLLYPLKYGNDPHMRAIVFRKTTGEIRAQGGLWENALEIYGHVYGRENLRIQEKELKITFPSGASVKFSYLERPNDVLRHQGAAYTLVIFDEATHFSLSEIEYLIKRIRSARAKHLKQMILTCNPDPDWELLDWIKPYLNEEGTPDQSRDGVYRYYVVDGGQYIWADTREELESKYGTGHDSGIKSFTFISANCMDNVPLMKADPTYLSNLRAQPWVDVQRYLYGNWYVRPTGSTYFQREWCEEIDYLDEEDVARTVRLFDFAATVKSDLNPSPDYTASSRMRKMRDGDYIVDDVRRTRIRAGDWLEFVLRCAENDPPGTTYYIPEDPGAAAKRATMLFIRDLIEAGLDARKIRTNKSKLDRFRPFSALAENGSVKFLSNCGIDEENNIINDLSFVYRELEAFTGQRKRGEMAHDDVLDTLSDGAYVLASDNNYHVGDIGGALSNLSGALRVSMNLP